jgi:hypothetical protein
MTPELEKFYDNAFSMMATEGWKDFMEDVKRIADSYDKLSSVTETHTLDFRRGQMDILNWMLGLRTAYEETYDQLQQESN